MSITYGFFDSTLSDIREYTAEEVGSLFDGLINDGVYMAIGDKLMVSANNQMLITVGSGRAWFNHTWTLNDSSYVVKLSDANLAFPRIDTIVLEVDSRITVLKNTIKVVEGIASQTPVAKSLIKTNEVWQYPLAHIYVAAGVREISQSAITNMVGTSECPFVTGIIQTMTIDSLVAQWGDQWTQYFLAKTKQMNSDWDRLYNRIVGLLGEEPATNLALAITRLQDEFNEQKQKLTELQNKFNLQIGNTKIVITTKGAYTALTNKDPNTIYIYPK